MTINFDKISLTAKLAAYMRQFSDIPYASEVAYSLRAQEAFDSLLRNTQMRPEDLLWYAPIFEVRYKSIAGAIRKSGIKQVLELASGLSLRGLAMAQNFGITYVDTDLEELTEDKASIISTIQRQSDIQAQGDYHLEVANALDRRQLLDAARHFQHGAGGIAVVNEGLFQYLSSEEMETVARNVHELLVDYGGVWITPDFSLKVDVRDVSEQQRKFRSIVAAATDRTMYNNAFADINQLNLFISRQRFTARAVNQLDEIPHLISVDRLNLPQEFMQQIKPGLRLWILENATE